ncbi:TPA: bacteriocin immunity protein [Vibrio harveyi]|uniref:bacteriocin immunity protein n=1 Tax=Vibrio TaxID=662 RepID=UPI0003B209B0|nr:MULTISPECIES: bacteriocin immunity protein [Vibrio]EGQ8551859.1 bacteriocin immunity protein [Vibrio parahaemolyticus]QLK45374.1 bacteriocin immunity protein [Vibrio owensii]AWA98991.1 bacteriocin immunity protein [Vibrio harveyi]EKO3838848.1 bacteriocin immunity protein [Vibrio harveyi]CCO42260.1 Colicin-E8 immunity protein [Vibrio nigripulchritudo SFn135]
MRLHDRLEDYTEFEFLELLNTIISAEGSDEYQDELLENFIATTEHPEGSDLIYYPENPEDGKSESIVRIVKEWRLSQGLPGFKS